jgi:hypothetical protein
MVTEKEYVREYTYLISRGLDVPIAEKERVYWAYRLYLKDLTRDHKPFNKTLLKYMINLRRVDFEIFLEKICGD